jgi:hypothetical protein
MENEVAQNSYQEAKENAKIFYKSIKRVWCPALNDFVSFGGVGFAHLIKKERRSRAKSEQKRRFALLPYVGEILKSKPFSSTEERIIGLSHVRYWKFIDYRNGEIIKVIVRQMDNGSKHFLSVYGRKQKSAHESANS